MDVSTKNHKDESSVLNSEDHIENEVSQILKTYKGVFDDLIPILQQIQRKFTYLPEQAMQQVAKFLNVPDSKVYGVATFYAFFKFKPTGKNVIRVCRGTACHVKGAEKLLEELESQLGVKSGESTEDLEYHLETVACIGACALAPTFTENEETYAQMTKKKIAKMFKTRNIGE